MKRIKKSEIDILLGVIPRADSGVFYKDFSFSPTVNYLNLMKGLGISQYSEAHLDPDLQRSILKERYEHWRGLFGQSGAFQGTLHNRNVSKGDIFLFFGWFKRTKSVNGVWKYDKNAPGIHAIYGYLEVDKVLDISAMELIPPWTSYHLRIATISIKNEILFTCQQNHFLQIKRNKGGAVSNLIIVLYLQRMELSIDFYGNFHLAFKTNRLILIIR